MVTVPTIHASVDMQTNSIPAPTKTGITSVWLISDSVRTGNYLKLSAESLGYKVTANLTTEQLDKEISSILTNLNTELPSLVWVSNLNNDSTKTVPERTQVAVRLLISSQHSLGGQFLLENANEEDSSRGVFLTNNWQSSNHRGTCRQIWWCALGLDKSNRDTRNIKHCAVMNVFASVHVPERLIHCCKQSKYTGRSILPSRFPKAYYSAMTNMLSECLTEPSASAYKTQQKQKPKPVKPTPDESPGDHEDTEGLDKPAKKVEVENVFDDCGDDVSTIAGSEVYTYFDGDSEAESSDDEMGLFNEEFYTWALTGSTTCVEEPIHERPRSLQFKNMTEAYTAIGQDPKYKGQHDLCELFGGEAGTTRVCIRRGLKTGPSFDINIGIDLTNDTEVAHLWKYILRHRPKVIVAGPPCTSFGPWSRINRYKAYDTWRRNRLIGEKLALLTAKLCMYQLTQGLHFLVENPEQSEIWKLPLFVLLLADPRVVTATLDQCQVGLVDPAGSPTKKPTLFIASNEALVKRLRMRCKGEHHHALLAGSINGANRCKFAQVWPRRLVELIAAGIIETLKQTVLYPAVVRDPYGGKAKKPAAKSCPGCRAHARRNDPRHDRGPNCGFQYDDAVTWECPACKSNKPSTHAGHSFDDLCQWTDAPTRRRGAQTAPATLRDPRIPAHQAPAIAPSGAELLVPPPVRSTTMQFSWTPLTNLETVTDLDQCRNRDGWHKLRDGAALVQTNGRSLRSPEPRFDASTFNLRSSYGFFPDINHSNGSWWQLELKVKYTEPEYEMNLAIGYAVPILVQIFSKPSEVRPIENIIRRQASSSVGLPPQNAGIQAMRSLMQEWDEEESKQPAEAAEDGAELLPPAINPQPAIGAEPDIDIQPEWSSFDLGSSLRALRSDNVGHQNKALRRLHLRWFHASTARMTGLLRAAGVSAGVLQRISATVDSCKICRMWKAPGRKTTTTSSLADKFNEVIQVDLLFVEEFVILHLIDESIRWTTTSLLADRQASTIIKAITTVWLKIFGPMQCLVSDQEGGLAGEESAIWAERWKISLRLKAKGQHAVAVERHHSILRDALHRMLAQARSEKLLVDFEDVLSEATYAKNVMLSINGTSPYVALFGRFPQILGEFEAQGQSAITDGEGGIRGASRHSVRLREIAIANIAESQASQRLKQAERSQSRLTGELLDLRCGELVDIFRQPQNKDLTGWRGPASIVDVTTIPHGHISVRWGGRTMSVRLQDMRRSVLFIGLTDDGSVPLHTLRQYMLNVFSAVMTLAWIFDSDGWRLSKTAVDNPGVFRSILHVAINEFNISKCLGARIGRGVHILHGLSAIECSTLYWWPANNPQMYRTLQHGGNLTLELKPLFQCEDITDICWCQFLSTSSREARILRRNNPDIPQLAPDPDEPPRPPRDDMSVATRLLTPRSMDLNPSPPPSPPQTRQAPRQPRPTSTRPTSTNDTRMDPFDLPDEEWRRIRPPTLTPQPTRSRSRGVPSSTTTPNPSPTISRDGPRRPIPSNVEPAPTTKRNKTDADRQTQRPAEAASHSWQTPNVPTISINPANVPVPTSTIASTDHVELPIHSDSDDTEGTVEYENFVVFYHDTLQMVFLSEDGTPVVHRDLSELSKAEVDSNWELVAAAIRTELMAFSDNKSFELEELGTSQNAMTSRWVLRWKIIDGVRSVKARLTVHGFKDVDADWLQTYAGTASRWSQRVVTAVSAQQRWEILTADVGNAFLKGLTFKELAQLTGEPERRVAFHPPKGYESFIAELPGMSSYNRSTMELRMRVPIYGLKDAPRGWRKKLHISLLKLGGTALRTDQAMYYWHDQKTGKLVMLLSAHVDDLKITGTAGMIEMVLSSLTAMFGKLKVQRKHFEHCGVMYDQDKDFTITTHQNHYVLGLKAVDMTTVDVTKPLTALTTSQHSDYLSLLGGLSWLSQTRLDMCIYVQALQRAAQSPTVGHLQRLNCVVKWVRRKPAYLHYRQLSGPIKVAVISDAAFRREDKTGLAMRGCIIALAETHASHPGGHIQIIDFYSRRQRRVVRSTFGAELNALVDGFETGKLLAFTMAELLQAGHTIASLRTLEEKGEFPTPIEAVIDCRSIYDALVPSDTKVPTEGSLVMILLQIKEALVTGVLKALWWVDTADMLSDGLNKGLVARTALLSTSSTGLWKLNFPAVKHTELPKAWLSSISNGLETG